MSGMTMDMERDRGERGSSFRLTGRKVLIIILTCFGIVASVNALMIHYALSTFRGEVADHPYEVGLAYNAEITAARAQEARGWRVEAHLGASRKGVEVTVRDAQGHAVPGLEVAVIFGAPVDAILDRRIALNEKAAGVYAADAPLPGGHWDLEILAKRDGDTEFQSKSRIFVK